MMTIELTRGGHQVLDDIIDVVCFNLRNQGEPIPKRKVREFLYEKGGFLVPHLQLDEIAYMERYGEVSPELGRLMVEYDDVKNTYRAIMKSEFRPNTLYRYRTDRIDAAILTSETPIGYVVSMMPYESSDYNFLDTSITVTSGNDSSINIATFTCLLKLVAFKLILLEIKNRWVDVQS